MWGGKIRSLEVKGVVMHGFFTGRWYSLMLLGKVEELAEECMNNGRHL